MNPQSIKIFLDRYALRTPTGKLMENSFHQLADRLGYKFARSEEERIEYSDVLRNFDFVPGGRILSGTSTDSTLFNCFVLPIRNDDCKHGADSRKAIMHTMTNMVEICARGGGVGINWSVLRPTGEHIHGVNGKSSGSTSWMQGADALADQIRQGGTRTAALMWMLDVWHPDMWNFVTRTERFKRANFSVGISNAFMERVKSGGCWDLIFPDITQNNYDQKWDGDIESWIDKNYVIKRHQSVHARDLFQGICESAGRIGSPGLVFLDTCNQMSNTWYLERLQGTNPCGEQPLPSYGSCNLGSINLVRMWDEENGGGINLEKLDATVRTAVKFLDRVTDISKDILKVIGDQQRDTRRVGLGTMGLADVLIMSDIRYGSEECLEFIDKLYSMIRDSAYAASIDLAEEYGPAPALDIDKFLQSGFVQTLPVYLRKNISRAGIRNLTLLSQAPTGTTSLLAGVSSGIEPIFAKEYIRKDATGVHTMTHPLFDGYQGDHLITAHELSFREHIAVQAQVQKYIDSAVSKTINLPACATDDQIGEAYMLAWRSGCKGITVYRDGSLEGVCEICEAN